MFGQMLVEYQDQFAKKAKEILKDLRLLPSNVKFRVQLDAWAAAALEELEAEGQEKK